MSISNLYPTSEDEYNSLIKEIKKRKRIRSTCNII